MTGVVPIIETPPAFWNDALGGCTAFRDVPLSVAHWGVTCPLTPNAWPTWTFWDYTSTGTVAGVSGNVDRLYFSGTQAQLEALGI